MIIIKQHLTNSLCALLLIPLLLSVSACNPTPAHGTDPLDPSGGTGETQADTQGSTEVGIPARPDPAESNAGRILADQDEEMIFSDGQLYLLAHGIGGEIGRYSLDTEKVSRIHVDPLVDKEAADYPFKEMDAVYR